MLACDRCYSLKAKCTRIADEGQCSKCAKAGAVCVNTRSRRKRQATRFRKPAKGRVAQLESRLDNILSLLESRNVEAHNHTYNSSGVEKPSTESQSTAQQAPTPYDANLWRWTAAPELERYGDTIGQADFGFLENQVESSTTSSDSFLLESAGLIVPASVLQYLTSIFKQMAELFPFVRLPQNISLQVMAETRPFLLLAAVTAAAYEYPKMQQVLCSEVKQIIMETIVGDGESNLDLLQGLLVHLAWFHFHSKRITGQRYTYLQLAISMARELGIDDDIDSAFRENSRIDISSNGNFSDSCRELDKDCLRAYLGCYFLSTTTASLSGKPNHLPLSSAMLRSAMFLQESQDFKTDSLIYPLLKIQSLAENVIELYRSEASSSSLDRLHMHSHRLLGELESWRFSVPKDLVGSTLLTTRYHITQTQILEMGLVFSCPRTDNFHNPSSCIDDTDSNHLEIVANLVRSTDAAKRLFDDFLHISSVSFNHLPLSEWHQIIYATIVLYRLSTGLTKVAGWDTAVARQGADLEQYLGLLIEHIRSGQSGMPALANPGRTLYNMSLDILESVRMSYTSLRYRPLETNGGLPAHEAMRKGTDLKMAAVGPGRTSKCPGLRNLASRSNPTDVTVDTDSTVHQDVLTEIEAMQHLAFWQGIFPEQDRS